MTFLLCVCVKNPILYMNEALRFACIPSLKSLFCLCYKQFHHRAQSKCVKECALKSIPFQSVQVLQSVALFVSVEAR